MKTRVFVTLKPGVLDPQGKERLPEQGETPIVAGMTPAQIEHVAEAQQAAAVAVESAAASG